MKISACVITKNEEKNLPRWLASMAAIADELVVVDTGSADRTVELAREAGAHVYSFPWRNDFSAAKNYAIEQATGDWIIFCDADETFRLEDAARVKETIAELDGDASVIAIVTRMVDIDVDAGNQVIGMGILIRIFRNLPDFRYHGAIHELLSYTGPGKKEAKLVEALTIYHTGYSSSIMREKGARNRAILEAEEAAGRRPYLFDVYMADACFGLGDFETAAKHAGKAVRNGEKMPEDETRTAGVWLQSLVNIDAGEETISAAFSQVEELFPGAPVIPYLRAYWARRRGAYGEERDWLRESLAAEEREGARRKAVYASRSIGSHVPEIKARLAALTKDAVTPEEARIEPRKLDAMRQRIYDAMGAQDYGRAEKEILSFLPIAPTEGLGLLVSCYIELGKVERAAEAMEKLRELAPDSVYTRFLAARVALQSLRYVTAYKEARSLLQEELIPVYREKVTNLYAYVSRTLGLGEKAVAGYLASSEAAYELGDRDLAAAEYGNALFARHLLPPESPAEEREAAAVYGAFWQDIIPFLPRYRRPGRKIRVGYLSPDLRRHVVFCFAAQMLLGLDDRFEVYAYQTGSEDAYSAFLASRVACWRNVAGKPDADIARLIYEDGVDILVELAGHTSETRLPVLAYKPAPVQISGIGYFASTGLPAVDYFLGDVIMDRQEEQEAFTEKLLRLPHSHFCYIPYREVPPALEPAVKRKGYITFGSFNNFSKLSDEVLAAWGKILARVPGSRLFLKCAIFEGEEGTSFAREKLQQAGIDLARVDTESISQDYLGRYGEVDIALDTFPYPGGGTTADALYMGIPVVALTGASHGGRFPLSLLTNAGIGELCAPSIEAYIDRAVALANDVDTLTLLHENLRTMMRKTPLLDAAAYGRELSEAYASIWEKYLSEQRPPSYEEMRALKKKYDGFLAAGDNRQALAAADRILAGDPHNDEWRTEFAERYIDGGDAEGAEIVISGLAPSGWRTYLYAQVAMLRGKWQEAQPLLLEALDDGKLAKWQVGAIHSALATCHKRLGDHRGAAEEYLASCKCKSLDTGLAQEYSNYLLSLHYYEQDAEKLLAAAKGYGALFENLPALAPAGGYGHDRLRVGIISPDFRRHVVAAFALAFFEGRGDDSSYAIGYYTGEPDDVTGRFAAAADAFFDLWGKTPLEQAKKIRADEIDILVDLSGHTGDSALPVLAYRPAPVQLSGIGYFDTTGLPAVDYFLVDSTTAPVGEESFFTERLLRLTSHLCYSPLLTRPVNLELPSERNGFVTFGCLGNADKLTEELLALWQEILAALPTSRLYLQAAAYGDEERLAREKARLEAAGIPLSRVAFAGYQADYLAAYDDIDIALDTWPYPGGGTTADALYMGVPVVSRYGAHHHSRFGLSMLSAAGLAEACACQDGEAYARKALALAGNAALRRELRQNLRARLEASPLMDGARYRAELEAFYKKITERAGKKGK